MRGDRPERVRDALEHARAAPHARGSTPQICGLLGAHEGCPACAGIDPSPQAGTRSWCWLPRMRGDRPAKRWQRRTRGEAAPHARGSTRGGQTPPSARRGCPACAGIDPRQAGPDDPGRGLPRMRGDRPDESARITSGAAAAPHARGSTLDRGRHGPGLRGCPACAGIDPARPARLSRSHGLPRMRGDRPARCATRVHDSLAAPHARGSTLRRLAHLLRFRGCPACAGIDPTLSPRVRGGAGLPRMRGDRPTVKALTKHTRRLPRMRGDRPQRCRDARRRAGAAPHARGSTPSRRIALASLRGCPACAGIDPRARLPKSCKRWLPRMRGDRPSRETTPERGTMAAPHARGSTHLLARADPVRAGCPACAGIDPSTTCVGMLISRLPRMRGDRPRAAALILSPRLAAPHARGSTLTEKFRDALRKGCPACAGIDPCSRTASARSIWLPRMRGDRPPKSAEIRSLPWAAPHARGSTHKTLALVNQHAGCPACAGIDPALDGTATLGTGLPRMRGDRPLAQARSTTSAQAAPHARGSTRRR